MLHIYNLHRVYLALQPLPQYLIFSDSGGAFTNFLFMVMNPMRHIQLAATFLMAISLKLPLNAVLLWAHH